MNILNNGAAREKANEMTGQQSNAGYLLRLLRYIKSKSDVLAIIEGEE